MVASRIRPSGAQGSAPRAARFDQAQEAGPGDGVGRDCAQTGEAGRLIWIKAGP